MKQPFWLCTWFIIFLSFSVVLTGQSYLFDIQHISVEDGLPNRFTLTTQQDKDGFIWVSSKGILSRFDGINFKSYDAGFFDVQDANYLDFFIDDSGLFWVFEALGHHHRYKIFNTETEELIPIDDFLKDIAPFTENEIDNRTNQKDGSVKFSMKDGRLFHYKNGKFEQYYQHFASLKLSIQKDEWFTHGDTLFRFNDNNQIDQFFLLPFPILRLYELKNQLLVHTEKGGLYFIENKEFREVLFSEYGHTRFLESDKKNRLWWLSGDRTLTCLTTDGHPVFKQKIHSKISGRPIQFEKMFIDKQDNIWLSSNDGIVKLSISKNPFSVYLKGQSTRGIARIGNELTVNSYGGNQVINLEDNTILENGENKIGMGIMVEKDIVWVGNEAKYIDRIDWKTKKINTYEGDISSRTLLPYRHPTNGQLLIGASTRGILFLDEKDDKIKYLKTGTENLDYSNVRHFYHNEKGLWVVTSGGLFLLDNQYKVIGEYGPSNGFKTNSFSFIHHDEEDIYWLATKGKGLIKLNLETGEKHFFGRNEGLFNENLYAVYEDDFGFLWLPSDYGLMRMNKTTFQVSHFSPANGIPHEEFNTYSHYQDREGNFYFGSLGGVIKFHPKDFVREDSTETPLFLTKAKKLGKDDEELSDISKEIRINNVLTFRPSDKYFELHFAYLDYKKIDENRYAFKIEGYDNQWQYTDDNFIKINALPYGDYTLNVKGQGSGGLWSNQVYELKIKVLKPFYLQTWFFVLLAFLIIGGFYGYVKWRERQLQRETTRLEKEVKKRTATISRQAEELKSLDKAKSRFFSNITHEFRTPLTLITGPLEQFLEEQKSKRLSMVLQNAKQLQLLINQLLDISKLENNKMAVETTHGDIVNYSKNLVYQFQELGRRRNHKIYFNCPFEDWKTHFDKDKWNKILYNLISNAVKFTPKNGFIQVNLAAIREDDGDWITLTVQDTGRGISAEKLPHIFDRFYQTDSSSTREAEGTGIGLALVKELVEVQNGQIKASSEKGVGTTFDIRLPVLKTPINPIEDSLEVSELPIIESNILGNENTETAIEIATPTHQLEILIIEDNADMRQYIRSCVEGFGYHIRLAKDGQEGIEIALETIPDLIISDVMMPRKNGFEVTSVIRNDIRTSHIPVVLLTARAALESRLEGLERGADAYLTKPFSPEELVVRIRKLIELRQSIQKRFKNGAMNEEADDIGLKLGLKKENKFLQMVEDAIMENILDTELTGSSLAKKLFISRGHFYRKIKALTDLTPHQYINIVRVKKAIPLLQSGAFTVTEVAYEVGFSTPNYFSRVCKQVCGKSPSELINS